MKTGPTQETHKRLDSTRLQAAYERHLHPIWAGKSGNYGNLGKFCSTLLWVEQ
ncbi:MAG: hypothetical protein ABW044_04505 [Cellvibrio sp.]